MGTAIGFRWLGAAGIELEVNGQILAIDPFFSRFPFWRLFAGRVRSDRDLVAEKLPRCDLILVTHSHFDHVMDVPDVMRNTGAMVLGSANSCRLVAADGIPALRIHEIHTGDRLGLANYQVEVLRGEHGLVFGRPVFAGPLPRRLTPPLGARDYRMDECFSFLIEGGGWRLLDWANVSPEGAAPADVLFVAPAAPASYYEALLAKVQPRIVIPIHWDDLFRPLSQPVRPMLKPPARRWPFLQRVDLSAFERSIGQVAPEVRVLVPEIFRTYDLAQLD